MDRQKATTIMHELLTRMVEQGGSDLFITADYPPAMKVDGQVRPVAEQQLSAAHTATIARAIMNDRQNHEFESTKECNFAIHPRGIGRFRVNAFLQQGRVGLVLRTINTRIPGVEELALPAVLTEVIMSKRGLVMMVGATGSGKSTTLAALIGYRNANSHGHIITIEDPVEYVHPHGGCLVTQREVGVDTENWQVALKNTLRQAPDVILIGEVRERQTMEYALQFAETGHLCLCTLHANNANQALDRVINLFPEEKREQVLMDLSLNLQAIVSQRLIPRADGEGRVAAFEVLLGTPAVKDLIFRGEIAEIRELMSRTTEQGLVTFDQYLFQLFDAGAIGYEDALRNADSKNELRLKIKLEGRRRGGEEETRLAMLDPGQPR